MSNNSSSEETLPKYDEIDKKDENNTDNIVTELSNLSKTYNINSEIIRNKHLNKIIKNYCPNIDEIKKHAMKGNNYYIFYKYEGDKYILDRDRCKIYFMNNKKYIKYIKPFHEFYFEIKEYNLIKKGWSNTYTYTSINDIEKSICDYVIQLGLNPIKGEQMIYVTWDK